MTKRKIRLLYTQNGEVKFKVITGASRRELNQKLFEIDGKFLALFTEGDWRNSYKRAKHWQSLLFKLKGYKRMRKR